MNEPTRTIPDPIKREVRKRCGFGCVICGKPLYEYDHMKEWALVKEHKAEDICLLCDEHHKQVTNKLLSRETVIKANNEPFNLKTGTSSGLKLIYDGDSCSINMGNSIFSIDFKENEVREEYYDNKFAALLIDLVPIIEVEFEENHPLFTICLYDKENNLILHIVKNEIFYSIESWDIEFKSNILTIREEARKITLRIGFNPPNNINIISGVFYLNGLVVDIKKDGISINKDGNISNGKFHNSIVGISICDDDAPVPAAIALGGYDRFDVDELIKPN